MAGARDAVGALAGIRVRSRTRAQAPGRPGAENATAGRPLWSSSPRRGDVAARNDHAPSRRHAK